MKWFNNRTLFRKNNDVIKVLAYHKVNDKSNFEVQLKYLKSKYNILDVEYFRDHLMAGKKFPKNSLLITFDDGDSSLYFNALPILTKYEIPATVFVVTELIDTSQPFWWEEVRYYLGQKKGNQKVLELKNMQNPDRIENIKKIRSLYRELAYEKPQLTTAQLIEMHSNNVKIANHSHTHPMFNQCSENELREELIASFEILNKLNLLPEVFAYPNGNFSSKSEGQLILNKIQLAFLFDHKINKGEINPLRISRLKIDDTTSLRKMKFILSGRHSLILPVIKFVAKNIKYKG